MIITLCRTHNQNICSFFSSELNIETDRMEVNEYFDWFGCANSFCTCWTLTIGTGTPTLFVFGWAWCLCFFPSLHMYGIIFVSQLFSKLKSFLCSITYLHVCCRSHRYTVMTALIRFCALGFLSRCATVNWSRLFMVGWFAPSLNSRVSISLYCLIIISLQNIICVRANDLCAENMSHQALRIMTQM